MSTRSLGLVLLLATVLSTGRAATNPSSTFAVANRLYEQGKFAEAAKTYESLRSTGLVSPALLFNLGNSWFKNGETGRAIATYREALELSPRDPDLQANLIFARESVGARFSVSIWRRWLSSLTLNEWTALACATSWLGLGLLTAGTLRPSWRPGLGTWRRLALVTVVLTTSLAVTAWADRSSHLIGVVAADEAVVRYGPIDESQSQYTLPDGAEVEVLDRNGDWLQVRDTQKRTGWIKAQQVIQPRRRRGSQS